MTVMLKLRRINLLIHFIKKSLIKLLFGSADMRLPQICYKDNNYSVFRQSKTTIAKGKKKKDL